MRTVLLIWLTCCCLPLRSVLAQEAGWEKPQGNPKELVNSIGMKLVLIPKGTFTRENSPVTISQAYYLGVYEVTQEQNEKVMGTNPSYFQGDHVAERDPETGVVKEIDSSSHPVENVSWDDAVQFCKRLSELPEEKAAGRVYRLPTEAEWEYACRAGTTTKFSFGDDERQLGDYAWFSGNSSAKTRPGRKTHPVGQKKPNAWSLYDMHGNVWEWCSDWYDEYPEGAVSDPVGPREGVGRVYRGGSWSNGAASCRSSIRGRTGPANRSHNCGFRLALSSPGIPQKVEPDK